NPKLRDRIDQPRAEECLDGAKSENAVEHMNLAVDANREHGVPVAFLTIPADEHAQILGGPAEPTQRVVLRERDVLAIAAQSRRGYVKRLPHVAARTVEAFGRRRRVVEVFVHDGE